MSRDSEMFQFIQDIDHTSVLGPSLDAEGIVEDKGKNSCSCGIYIWKCRQLGFYREENVKFLLLRINHTEIRVKVIPEISFLRLQSY